MKIAIISDLHIGCRNDNEAIARVQDVFYRDFMVPLLAKAGITSLFCGGDFFDKRSHVTLKSMDFARSLERLFADHSIVFHCLVGNHDTAYRNTNDLNSLDTFFRNSPSVRIYSEPVELKEHNLLLVPWINSENSEACLKHIAESKQRFCLGHFAIEGFEFHKGTVCDHGLRDSLFNGFEKVLSGHFHTKSQNGNIHYLGSPYEMSWSDWNDPRGFHIFDTETGELEFIPFEVNLFYMLDYNDGVVSCIPDAPENFGGKFVKVVVTNKGSAYDYDVWLKSIQIQNPTDIQIIETKHVSVDSVIELSEEDVKKQIKGNLNVIQSYVDGMELDADMKQKVKQELESLYSGDLT